MTISDKKQAESALLGATLAKAALVDQFERDAKASFTAEPGNLAAQAAQARILADFFRGHRAAEAYQQFCQNTVGYYFAMEMGQPHPIPDGSAFGIVVMPPSAPAPPSGTVIGAPFTQWGKRYFSAARTQPDGTVEIDGNPDGAPLTYGGFSLRKIVSASPFGNYQAWEVVMTREAQ